MKKANNEIPKQETNEAMQEAEAVAAPHPAEVEAANLRMALADERVKTEALARRCIRLGDALDAAIMAEDNRIEQSMFAHINGNHCHREELIAAAKRRMVHEQKMAKAHRKACRKNAVALSISAVAVFAALLLGFTGFIHTVFAAILAGAGLMAFGWALNTCVYLFGRCDK